MNDPMLAEGSWWAEARKELILSLLEKYCRDKKSLCDVGCSSGTVLNYLKRSTNFVCCGVDSDGLAVKKARKNGLDVAIGNCTNFKCGTPQDVVLLLDVLEHVEEDEKAVLNCSNQLREGGVIIASVPAFSWMFSDFDSLLGHKRRYEKKEFLALFRQNGLEVLFFSYWNMFLLLPVFIFRNLFKRKNAIGCGEWQFSKPFDFFLKKILVFENFLIKHGLILPFGISIVVVALKNQTARKQIKSECTKH